MKYILGLSLGEVTSLCSAGVMSFEEGVKLVQKRGEGMQTASETDFTIESHTSGGTTSRKTNNGYQTGMMVVRGLTEGEIRELLESLGLLKNIEIGLHLTSTLFTLCGLKLSLQSFKSHILSSSSSSSKPSSFSGVLFEDVIVSGAFHHSIFMKPSLPIFSKALKSTQFTPIKPKEECNIQVMATTKALPYDLSNEEDIKFNLSNQVFNHSFFSFFLLIIVDKSNLV